METIVSCTVIYLILIALMGENKMHTLYVLLEPDGKRQFRISTHVSDDIKVSVNERWF